MQSFLVLPVIHSKSGALLGSLVLGSTSYERQWSNMFQEHICRVLSTWASSTLMSVRAGYRLGVVEAIEQAASMEDMARAFVCDLPAALVDLVSEWCWHPCSG